jgi:beta-N-acetylhexosaminidase
MTLEDLVGERLVFAIPGPTVSEADVRLFQDTRAAGLIVYRRNFESPSQFLSLLGTLEERLGRRLLVTTDHEGGRVIMLGQGTTIFPDNLAVGTGSDPVLAHRQGLIEARELRRLGIDVALGPVLDVLTDRYSPNIGIRSYGTDPEVVARLGLARIRGLHQGGLSVCPKHFPGKGHSPLDAHLSLPTIDSTWAEMHATHLPPFLAAIGAGAECVMTSHPRYPQLDPSGVPATFSRLIVTDYLRGEVGFRGVIVTDDLEMGAISESAPIGQAAVKAAAAGHDLLLVCHAEAAQRAVHAALLDAYRTRTLPVRELEDSAARVRRLRESRSERASGGPPRAERDGDALARAMATRAVTLVTPSRPDLGRRLNGRVTVVFPRLSELASRITIESALLDEARYVKSTLAPLGVEPRTIVVGIEPSDGEIALSAQAAAAADTTILFLFDARLYPSNRRLLESVAASAPACAVALLRDPYDAALLPPGVMGVTAYGFRRCQLDAVISYLLLGLHTRPRPESATR